MGHNVGGVEAGPSICVFHAKDGEAFLLCSDGLYNELGGALASFWRETADAAADDVAEFLATEALRHGGRDNITALVIKVTRTDALIETQIPVLEQAVIKESGVEARPYVINRAREP